ncbi:MAG: hypothetical protein JNK82_16130 [Myxococcaceae bacterium]|nr:hypothetical protein [Myxococcaceae bacterium]
MLEHAYDLTLSPGQWLDTIHQKFVSRLDQGFGVSIGSWAVAGPTFEFVEQSPLHGDAHPIANQAMAEVVGALSPEQRSRFYGPGAIDFIGSASDFGLSDAMQAACARLGLRTVRDGLGMLLVCGAARCGLVVIALSKQPVALRLAERRRLRRIVTHVTAAFRLRESLRNRPLAPAAVFSPDGALLHAEGAATGRSARRALEAAVRHIDRSRGRLRRTSPEEALSMWKGLVNGTWTIVDWVDTDARRFVVAHENHFSARSLRALSPREVDVAEYLAQGRSTSEIGYALGLQVGTVSRIARTVLEKLGVRDRSVLSGLFGDVPPLRAEVNQHEDLFVLAPAAHPTHWQRMTPSERVVVEHALRGHSLARIAQRRGSTVKTVKNLLGRVYARFGVRGKSELATVLGGPPGPR